MITQVDGHIIKTIDGKKAYNVYEEYFGQEANNLRLEHLSQIAILYPFGIFVEGSQEYLLRNAVDILNDGSIVCQGDVPEGAQAHIMIANKDSCRQAAVEAAKEAFRNLGGKKAKLIIVIEDMTRLKLLGRMAFHEIQKIKEIFGSDVPLIGMYANGELCPFQSIEKIKKPFFQNESIVILAIS